MKVHRRDCHPLLSLFLVSVTSLTAIAQEKPLTVETSTMQPSVLLGRPMLTWWDVKILGTGLMVGQLQFFIKSENQLLATFETEELTLNAPGQRIRVMLPAIDPAFSLDRLNVDISFRGKKFSGMVSEQILRIPFSTKKVFVGLVGESKAVRKRSTQRDQVLERLRFENIIPITKNSRGEDIDQEYVKTFFASIDPADFPSEPLAYCGYDLVVLMGDELRNLRKPQLEGMLAWIKAGGSLFVETNGVLESYHVDFLRSLIADDLRGLVIQVDSAGRLPMDTVQLDRAAVVVACGLGRAAIRTDNPDREMNVTPEAWLAIVGPLWKSRWEPKAVAESSYQVPGTGGQPVDARFANPDPWGLATANFNRFRLPQPELLDRLMPDGVRMVPLSLLAMILMVFVALIGPGDYFVLGWLRMRKLTWITFPVATFAVTALTVWLSNRYMSSAETRRAAVIRDLGSSGDVVRTNRFELLFVASSRRVVTTVEKGLFASLSTAVDFDANAYLKAGQPPAQSMAIMQNGQPMIVSPNMNRSHFASEGQAVPVPTQIQGRIPTQFNSIQDLAKWTPQLNRVFSISGTAVPSQVDWDDFNLRSADSIVIRRHELPTTLAGRVREHFGPQAMVACFHWNDGWAYDRTQGWRSTRSLEHLQRALAYNYRQQIQNANGIGFNQAPGEAEFFRWIYQASVAMPNPGVFRLMKQTAPKGGASCDDLPLLDSSDPKAWLLVVVVPEKEDYIVYRKLMRFQD